VSALPAQAIARFWMLVDKNGPVSRPELGRCWTWKGHRSPANKPWDLQYGRFSCHGDQRAHRFSYELHRRPIPNGLFVLHECDFPPCCNPDHLTVGTQLQNRRDASARGRTHGRMNEMDALRAFVWYADGVSQREIAKRLGVARNTVVCMLSGAMMAHVHAAVAQWCLRGDAPYVPPAKTEAA
jgi:hypothetical protein